MTSEIILNKNNGEVTQKSIKNNIKNYMKCDSINLLTLSRKASINYCILVFLLYFPFFKVRLTKAIKICKALEIKLSDILD